jgi:hypothetical protein
MFSSQKSWLTGMLKRLGVSCSGRRSPRTQLRLENLEDRLVPAITDMTQLAQQFPTPSAPTHLYLNFDGFTNVPSNLAPGNGNNHSVAAFTGSNQDIQDIIYRVSEIYAPFNVEVSRMYGNGVYDSGNGSTTIFIGADSANETNYNNVTVKYSHSVTPGQFADYPTTGNNTHQPHSDPFNLAYVDPVGENLPDPTWVNVISNDQIAEAIAHEAGHTFGLAHVLSNPTPDIMSYDATNQYFADKTFNITDLNFDGQQTKIDNSIQPNWRGTNITTQDSYTYLGAVLGYRQYGYYHVVDFSHVDILDNPPLFGFNYTLGQMVNGNLYQQGDYDVYKMSAPRTESVHIDLTPTSSQLLPELLIYQGGTLVKVVDGWWNGSTGNYEIHTDLQTVAGRTYSFVVGSAGGNSTGGYNFNTSDFLTNGIRLKGITVGIASTGSLSLGTKLALGTNMQNSSSSVVSTGTYRALTTTQPAAIQPSALTHASTSLTQTPALTTNSAAQNPVAVNPLPSVFDGVSLTHKLPSALG